MASSGQSAEDAAGVAGGDDVGGDGAGDDAAGADGGVGADADAGADDDAAAKPDVVAEGDGRGQLGSGAARGGVGGVVGGEKLDVGAALDVHADANGGAVEDDAAKVHEEAGAGADVGAVIAVKGRLDSDACADGAE